jgi:hypothetical protein
MTDHPERISRSLRLAITEAVQRAQAKIYWKPSKDIQHLTKRIRLGHLPAGATLAEYETVITAVLNDSEAKVYLFLYENIPYPTLVTTVENKDWLVMIGMDGVIETAFPPNNTETYLADPAFVYVGISGELQE